MKAVYTYGFLFAMMAITSCIEEQTDVVVPTPGEGVRFYASLNNIETKTIYGEEVYENGSGKPATAIKVNWVDGDMISVYGTTCLPDCKQGQYKVTGAINSENNSYASNLEMIGDHGVQWGTGKDSDYSDFYAVYPSVADGAFSKDDNGNIVVSTSIRSEQKNVFVEETTQDNSGNEVTIWSGTPYIDVTNNNVTTKTRTMPDALMYSYTPNVSSGSVVNLNFKPFATVLKFSINGWNSTFNLQDPTVYVQKIILTAPSGVALAGDCTFTFDDIGKPTAKAGSSISNVITINPVLDGADFLPLKRNDKVEFNVFVIPQSNDQQTNNMVLNENWSVRLETTHGNFTFKLTPNVPEGKKAELVAGQIHKIGIPTLMVKSQFTYDPENWIEAIPRNVYLTELSVPGAWYCNDATYQGQIGYGETINVKVGDKTMAVDKGLHTLHENGIRAYHIDCRLTKHTDATEYTLMCAGTEEYDSANDKMTGVTVESQLEDLSTLVSTSPKEYIVVVLTVAEKSKDPVADNSYKLTGTVAPEQVIPAIYKIINNGIENNWNIYIGKEGSNSEGIDANTTVGDVLGKMIVIVNANTSNSKFSTYGEGPVLISKASMATSNSGNIEQGTFDSMQTENMYWSNGTTPCFTYYFHHGQGTRDNRLGSSGFPMIGNRQTAISDVISQSYDLWDNGRGEHNSMFLLGIGGYIKNFANFIGLGDEADHAKLARNLNAYVLGIVQDKLDATEENSSLLPSPVGIVLMNHATSNDASTSSGNGNGLALVKAIIDMNGKFYLLRDENAEEWPE